MNRLENSIIKSQNKKFNFEEDMKQKIQFFENCNSKNYIQSYIENDNDFDTSVIKGLEEHIEDLMTQLYYLTKKDSDDNSYSTVNSNSTENSNEDDDFIINLNKSEKKSYTDISTNEEIINDLNNDNTIEITDLTED